MHSALGRGQASLSDTALCAAHSLCSVDSTRRAQVLVGHALHAGQTEKIQSILTESIGPNSVIILKRLWDETAIRVQLPYPDLRRMLGEQVAAHAKDVKSRGRGASRGCFPGFVVQSMQSMAFLRWGPAPTEACEVIVPAKIIASTDADSINNGYCAAMPMFDPDHLRANPLPCASTG